MQNYGDGGRTLNLLDYAEYMPGYMERREQYPHLSRYDTEDGKCYMLFPCLSDRISEVWYQNQDLMDKYGLETPTTWDEMKACLDVVCAGEDDMSGIICVAWGIEYYYSQFASMFGSMGRSPADICYDYDQGKWVFALTEYEDIYRTALEEFADVYAKGYIHPDFATWEGSVCDSYIDTGKWLFANLYVDETSNLTQQGLNYTYITTPTALGAKPHVRADYRSDNTGWIYMISNTTQYPELCALYLELLTSEEYAVAARWGFEGVTYTVDENGKRAFTDEYLNMDIETRKATYLSLIHILSLYPPVYAAMEACNTPVEYYGGQNLGELWQELAPETPSQYQAAFRAQYTEVVNTYLYDYVEGNMPIEEFAEAVKADMEQYIQ